MHGGFIFDVLIFQTLETDLKRLILIPRLVLIVRQPNANFEQKSGNASIQCFTAYYSSLVYYLS